MTTRPAESAQLRAAKPLILSLDQIKGTDLPLVGGKAFRLAVLRQHNLAVPPGLVLTTPFFEAQLQHAQLVPLWAGSPDVAVTVEALSWLSDDLKIRPLARELSKLLVETLDATFGTDVDSFAVRSSAIDEDQRDYTFAGVHLTELGVPRSALPIAITRCWASALSSSALEYRQVHGLSIQGIRIAVLIQPMLSPEVAGVAFTVNPLTGARDELVIEASWGLGESLVSGNVQPYFYRLSSQPPDYPVLEQRSGNNPPLAEQADQGRTSPLSAAELTELAVQLEQIQALMGEAQDVEWARLDGKFFFLQSRPALVPQPPSPAVDQEWTRGSHPEFLPELPSPLFSSLLERTQGRAITFFKELGFQLGGLGPYVRLILGRPYLNLTFLKRVIAQVGVNPGSILYTIGHTEPGSAGGSPSIDWEAAWRARSLYRRVFTRLLGARDGLRKYQALADEIAATLAGPDFTAAPTTLLAHLRLHDRAYNELFNANLGLASAMSALTAIGSRLIAPLTPNPATVITTLALKEVRTDEGELNQALLRLGRLAGRDSQVQHYLANAPANFAGYEGAITSPEIRQSLADLLARFGARATYETDPGWPRYSEDPSPLLRIIRQYALSEQKTGDLAAAVGLGRPAPTWRSLVGPARGFDRFLPWRRWLAAPLIRMLSRLLQMRDELDRARAKAMTACRQWDLALGQCWSERGWLERPGDIFWLTLEEIEQTLMVGEGAGLFLLATVKARQETYRTYADTQMPFSLTESQIPLIQFGIGLSAEPLPDVVVGLPISPGQARGIVVVLRSPEEFKKIADDIILVTPSTDPAWLPLLHLAAGLIVEMGGLLSHGSVIAREYGLPAVANIPNATGRFRTGDCVLVDGSTGVVQLLETAPGSTVVENSGS